MQRTSIYSPYMEFAKLRSSSRYNLATSGILSYALSDLPVSIDQLEINGPTQYGYEPLIDRLAKKNGVARECVMYVNGGTSLANAIAIAGTTEHGDHVLAELPGYELLDSTARFLGLDLEHFERRFENGFRIDPAELRRKVTSRTRLIVLTNLHNPTGVLTDEETMREIGSIARNVGARVLVDEVYLDMAWEHTPPSSFLLDPETFVVTNSLTKAYGLSGLRCGWILAEPKLAERFWRINDLYAASPVHMAEVVSIVALDNLERVVGRAKSLLSANRALLDAFFQSCDAVEVVLPEFGTIAFPRVRHGNVEKMFDVLRDRYETTVVPGTFFGAPQHFRVGVGGETEMTREGLQRLAVALREN